MRRLLRADFALPAILLGLAGAPAGANAAPITETISFIGSGFPAGAPFDPVTGSATVTFDPAVDQSVTPLPSFSSTLPASYEPFSFVYFATSGNMIFGDNCTVGCSVLAGKNQASVSFQLDATGTPTSQRASLSYAGVGFTVLTASSVVITAARPVPEPASLALLGTGILGLTFIRRRRRKSTAGHAGIRVLPPEAIP